MGTYKNDVEIYQKRNFAFKLIAEDELKQKENSTDPTDNFLQFFEAVYKHWLKTGNSAESDWHKVQAKIDSRKLWMKTDGCFK